MGAACRQRRVNFVNDGPFAVYLKKEENPMKSTKHMWKRCLSVLLVLCMVGAFILPNIKVNAADTDADLWVDRSTAAMPMTASQKQPH